ncbi:hypothetical protein CF319_g6779 [Tilletia indica]|nr:hypothetical protein CF319_g6779 [Tilletia indica]
MSRTTDRAIRRTPALGVPAVLTPQTEMVQNAYMNSGRMSEGLAKLQSTTYLFQQAARRNQRAAAFTEVAVARALTAMQDDVKRRLVYSHNRLGDEVEHMKIRMEKELACAHEAVQQAVQETILIVRRILEQSGSDVQDGLKEAVEMHNNCGATLQRDINNTEADYMDSIAQVMVSNVWTTAMPEAVRILQHDGSEERNAPPQYGTNMMDESAGIGATGTSTAEVSRNA